MADTMDEQVISKVKPSAVVRPTSVVVPETEVGISSSDSGSPDAVNIQKQSQALQETLQQCAKVATYDDVSNLAKHISTLTEQVSTIASLLPQLVANNQQQQASNTPPTQAKASCDDQTEQTATSTCNNIDKGSLQELIAKQIQQRNATGSVPVIPLPPPPPSQPSQPTQVDAVKPEDLEKPANAVEMPREKPAEETPKGAMLEELNKKLSGGLKMRAAKPVEKKEPMEKSHEFDFKKGLKPAKVRANPPSLDAPTTEQPQVDSEETLSPIIAQIKARNLQRRQSLKTTENKMDVEDKPSELKPRLKKTVSMPAGDIAQEKKQSDQDKFTLPFAFKLKRVEEKPAWCRETDATNILGATNEDPVKPSEHNETSSEPKPITVEEPKNVSRVKAPPLPAKPTKVSPVPAEAIMPTNNIAKSQVDASAPILHIEETIQAPAPPPPPPAPPQPKETTLFQEPQKTKEKQQNGFDEIPGTNENERGALFTAIKDFDLKSLRDSKTTCTTTTPASSPMTEKPDARGSLLSAIKDFSKDSLKKISNDKATTKNTGALNLNSILQSALKDRFRACNGNTGSDDENSDNADSVADDDEWYNAEE